MQFRLSHVAVGVVLAATSVSAIAQSSSAATRSGSKTYYMPYERSFWSYAGGSVGRSDYEIACRTGFPCDTRATGIKLFAGGKFNEFSGLEASYVHLGFAERSGGDTRAHGINLSFVGTVPLGQSFGLHGRIGAMYARTDTEGTTGPGFTAGRDDGMGLTLGAGLSYALTRTLDLRLDWDRYRNVKFSTGRDDIDFATVGVAFKF